ASALLGQARLESATTKLEDALHIIPGFADAGHALSDITERRRAYAAAIETAIRESERGNNKAARTALDEARGLDAEQYANDRRSGRTVGVITQITRAEWEAHVSSSAIVTASCDARCTILVDGLPRARLTPGTNQPMALTVDVAHKIVAVAEDGL